MLKLTQGDYPIYIAPQHVVAVKSGLGGQTTIVTTGHDNFSSVIVSESIEDVVSALEQASNKGASN